MVEKMEWGGKEEKARECGEEWNGRRREGEKRERRKKREKKGEKGK